MFSPQYQRKVPFLKELCKATILGFPVMLLNGLYQEMRSWKDDLPVGFRCIEGYNVFEEKQIVIIRGFI